MRGKNASLSGRRGWRGAVCGKSGGEISVSGRDEKNSTGQLMGSSTHLPSARAVRYGKHHLGSSIRLLTLASRELFIYIYSYLDSLH